MKLVSACLLGVKCRYDGRDKKDDDVLSLSRKEVLVPICPEQLGGLPTPREEQRIINGDGDSVLKGRASVETISGIDVTENFIKGAKESLKIARLLHIKEAVLKSRSPSCGSEGVTTALFRRNGIEVKSEHNLNK